MSGDGVEHLLVEILPSRSITLTLYGDQRLKRFQCLNCSLEADRTGFDVLLVGGLRDDGTDEIVSQDVCPDFLPHEFGRLTTCFEIQFCRLASLLDMRLIMAM
jgi:hypothetical protein